MYYRKYRRCKEKKRYFQKCRRGGNLRVLVKKKNFFFFNKYIDVIEVISNGEVTCVRSLKGKQNYSLSPYAFI